MRLHHWGHAFDLSALFTVAKLFAERGAFLCSMRMAKRQPRSPHPPAELPSITDFSPAAFLVPAVSPLGDISENRPSRMPKPERSAPTSAWSCRPCCQDCALAALATLATMPSPPGQGFAGSAHFGYYHEKVEGLAHWGDAMQFPAYRHLAGTIYPVVLMPRKPQD